MAVDYEEILILACDKFLNDLNRFAYSLVVEEDFRCGLYSEMIDIMKQKGLTEYNIRTEHIYKESKSKTDIALGEDYEVAVELKYDVFGEVNLV